MKKKVVLSLLILATIFPVLSKAEFRICTQNLYNYGKPEEAKQRAKKSQDQLNKQKAALARRITAARCDILAAQEVLAKSPEQAEEVLQDLAGAMSKNSKFRYFVKSGKSNDPISKLGYIIRDDLFELKASQSYSSKQLPKLLKSDRNRYFSRGPLRLDLREKETNQIFTVITFHFKSAASYHSYDGSGHQFEFDRMQMSAAFNEIVDQIIKAYPERTLIALGDRNSPDYSASAKIMRGELELNFFSQNICQLSRSNRSYGPPAMLQEPDLVSLANSDPDLLNHPLLRNKKYFLIDDLLINAAKIQSVEEAPDDYTTMLIEVDRQASDHPLIAADVNLQD